jgi:hypothetical protein
MTDLALKGSEIGDMQTTLVLHIDKCKGEDYCQKMKDIDDVLKAYNVELTYPTFYFDTDKLVKPVTISGLRKKRFGLLSTVYQEIHVPVQVNEAIVYDDYYNSFYPKHYKYYSIEELENTILTGRRTGLIEIHFEISPKYMRTERKVYSLMEVLGQIGGIIGILLPVGAILSSVFSSKIYVMTLLSLLYQVDQKQTSKVVPIEEPYFKFIGTRAERNRSVGFKKVI